MYTEGIKKIIEKSFLSVFETINKKVEINKDYKKFISSGGEKFSNWILDNYGTIPLFGINKSAHIGSLHVKLKFTDDLERERLCDIKDIINEIEDNNSNNEKRIGKYIDEVIDEAKINITQENGAIKNIQVDVAILGVAGSGKTTTLKYLMYLASKGKKFRGHSRFPFFIPLRDIKIENGFIIKYISNCLENFGFLYSLELCQKVIRSGLALILIDGIDELSESEQVLALREIQDIRAFFPESADVRSIICLSGRPYSLYRSLEGFAKYDVLDLSKEESDRLIENWYKDVDENKGVRLQKYVENNETLREISSNPLLLSIVCALYFNEYNIPKREDEILRSCLEGLMGKWDMFRDISRINLLSPLSITKRIDLLSILAANTLLNNRKVVFASNDEDVLKTCNYVIKHYSEIKEIDPKQLLVTLYNDFGVVIERSKDLFSFTHLKFQEYLLSKWIIDRRNEMDLLENISDSVVSWGYVIDNIAKNLKNPFDFLNKVSKIALSKCSQSDILFVLHLLKDREIILNNSDRFRIFRYILSWTEKYCDFISVEYKFDIGYLYIYPKNSLNCDINEVISCIELLLKQISNNQRVLSPVLNQIIPNLGYHPNMIVPTKVVLLSKSLP